MQGKEIWEEDNGRIEISKVRESEGRKSREEEREARREQAREGQREKEDVVRIVGGKVRKIQGRRE